MSQKLPMDGFKLSENTSQFDKDFLENCIEDINERHFLEVYVQYLEKLCNLNNDFPFLPWKNEHWKNWKTWTQQPLNHGSVLKKVHRVIKFNQKAWLK